MLKIKPSKRLLIGLIVASSFVFIASGFGYWNRSAALNKIQAEVMKKQQALEDSEKTAKRLERVEAEYEDARMKLACLEQGFLQKPMSLPFCASLRSWGGMST